MTKLAVSDTFFMYQKLAHNAYITLVYMKPLEEDQPFLLGNLQITVCAKTVDPLVLEDQM